MSRKSCCPTGQCGLSVAESPRRFSSRHWTLDEVRSIGVAGSVRAWLRAVSRFAGLWPLVVLVGTTACCPDQGPEEVSNGFVGEISGWPALGLGLDGHAFLTICAADSCQRLRVQSVNGVLRCAPLTEGGWACRAQGHQQETLTLGGPEFPTRDARTLGLAVETVTGAKAAVFRDVEPSTNVPQERFVIRGDASAFWIE